MTRATDPVFNPELMRRRKRYETSKTLLQGILVICVLTSLVMLVAQSNTIKQNQRGIKAQSNQAKELLEQHRTNDASRQKIIDEAVARIAQNENMSIEQLKALIESRCK